MAISPDGNFIAVGGDGAKIKLWRTMEGYASTEINSGNIYLISFSSDSSKIIAGGSDFIKVFEIGVGGTMNLVSEELNAHTGRVNPVASSGASIASGSSDGSVKSPPPSPPPSSTPPPTTPPSPTCTAGNLCNNSGDCCGGFKCSRPKPKTCK